MHVVSDAQRSLLLTSQPSSSEPYCQGRVQFTCTGTEISFVLNWVVNGSIFATYSFASSHSYPFPLNPVRILQSVSGGLEMVLQWSEDFNAEHNVERYNVRVNPDPESCTSDQVSPHQNYSCSGLDRMETNYSVSITAFTCINQENEINAYNIQPQLLGM